MGKTGDAFQACNKAIEPKPDYTDAWYGKGQALFGLHKYNDALEAFTKSGLGLNYYVWDSRDHALYHGANTLQFGAPRVVSLSLPIRLLKEPKPYYIITASMMRPSKALSCITETYAAFANRKIKMRWQQLQAKKWISHLNK